jgi:Tfp pilus assembly protein PilX
MKQTMKEKNKGEGFVLVVALIITLVVGMVTVSLVGVTLQEYRLSVRSAAYSKALHAAESGADLACEEFARQITAGGSLSGFNASGNLTNASGTVIASYDSSAVLSNSDTYVITSTGRVSLVGATIQRAIRMTIQKVKNNGPHFDYGILSRASIHMAGSVRVDSYDSTDPTKSTNGQYDPIKASRNGTLTTLSTDDPVIKVDGGAQLDGISILTVLEGMTVDIAHWISFSGSIVYIPPTYEIEDVTVPFDLPATDSIDTSPWKSRYQTITVSGSQDMSLSSLKVSSDGTLTITGSGKLRIYVDGKTTVSGSGQIRIVPTPSTADLKVEIYANDDVSIAGSGVLNDTYLAANCSIWGTENCTEVKVTGNSGYTGTIYAPYADVDLTGSSSASGAFLGGAVKFTGNTRFYIDESLIGGSSSSSSGSGKPYKLVSWVEL